MKKAFKFSLVLTLGLMLFSCSQEEDKIQENAILSQDANFRIKNEGLSEKDVIELTNMCTVMSNSAAFKNMRAQSATFSEMMNYHVDNTWSKRTDVEGWLNSNLSLTKFTTVQEGLDMFDSLTAVSKNVYGANSYFFESLNGATDPQLTIILDPIKPVYPVLAVSAAMDCMDLCVWSANATMDHAFNVYNATVRNIEMNNSMTYNQPAAYAAADAAFDSALNEAYQAGIDCLEACED